MSPRTLGGAVILAVAALVIEPASAQEPTLNQVYQSAASGNLAQAQRMMDEVLRAHPNSAKAHYVEAELLAKQGRLAAAETELNTAERLDPGLPFAKPQAVQELKQRLVSRQRLDSPSRSIAPETGGGIPWTPLLLVAGLIALVFIIVAAIRRRAPTYIPAAAGTGYGAPSPGQVYPGGVPGPMAPGGGGIGSGILGGLATGAALGAGMVAGEALAHRLTGEHGGASGAALSSDVAPSVPDNMGGADFGVGDSSSWDDNSGGGFGGGDWS